MMKTSLIKACEYIFLIAVVYISVMWYNFEFALTIAVLISGIIYSLDVLWLKKRRERIAALANSSRGESLSAAQKEYATKMSLWVDYARSFFWVLLIVILIRSWGVELFRIPSGSLEPTLLVGDMILVNKFEYGIRVPVLNNIIIPVSQPKRGDIVVFHWPVNPKIDLIKRVVGVPGDKISYVDKVLTINGVEAKQSLIKKLVYTNDQGRKVNAVEMQEDLLGVKHDIYQFTDEPAQDFKDIVVPTGMYFMMGDNRDDSADSRFWGFAPMSDVVGKTEYIVLSYKGNIFHPRLERTFEKVNKKNS